VQALALDQPLFGVQTSTRKSHFQNGATGCNSCKNPQICRRDWQACKSLYREKVSADARTGPKTKSLGFIPLEESQADKWVKERHANGKSLSRGADACTRKRGNLQICRFLKFTFMDVNKTTVQAKA
jgi:hypothetical protein